MATADLPRSTTDVILALRLLSELHREYNRPLLVAYVDIKAAFDSVDRMTLWKALKGKGVPLLVLKLLDPAYSESYRCEGAVPRENVQTLLHIVRSTSGLRASTCPVLHSHRLDIRPTDTASRHHSRRSSLYGSGIC